MGKELYVEIWKRNKASIINAVKDNVDKCLSLNATDFEEVGNRSSGYQFRVAFHNDCFGHNRGSAVARDLVKVLNESCEFRKYSKGKDIVIRMNRNFELFVLVSAGVVNVPSVPSSISTLAKTTRTSKDTKKAKGRVDSDEYYVIGLCNELLGLVASQQHSFDFLRGDSGKILNVDAYYPELNLVIEYCERQHTEGVALFDNRLTVSGVNRREQRRLYDQRRRDLLPQHGIKLVEIHYSDFGTSKKLKRNHDHDIAVVKQVLINSGCLKK